MSCVWCLLWMACLGSSATLWFRLLCLTIQKRHRASLSDSEVKTLSDKSSGTVTPAALAERMRCSQCGKKVAEVVAVARPRPRGRFRGRSTSGTSKLDRVPLRRILVFGHAERHAPDQEPRRGHQPRAVPCPEGGQCNQNPKQDLSPLSRHRHCHPPQHSLDVVF